MDEQFIDDETTPEVEDLDAAHRKIRATASVMRLLGKRVDRADVRLGTIESRLTTSASLLAEVQGRTSAIQDGLTAQNHILSSTQDQTDRILSRLDSHIKQEIEQESARTTAMERLHRTIIRATTVLGLFVVTALFFLREIAPIERFLPYLAP